MESSPLIREAEECSSCESGWTMYLASPIHDDGDSDVEVQSNDEEEDHDDDSNSNESSGGGTEGNEDNDSMASDASTGPIQHRHGDAGCDRSSVMVDPNNDVDDDELEKDERNEHSSRSCSKVGGVNKMRNGRRIGVSRREVGATSLFHTSSSKVRKTSEK